MHSVNSEKPTCELSDSQVSQVLVKACIEGNRDAMRRIYEATSGRVFGLMVRIVGRQDADDLTQQVFLQMFRRLDQFDGHSKVETWLYRLATNEALQHLRRRKRHTTRPLVTDPTVDRVNHVDASEESQLLETAIAQLDPELRTVLVLKEQQGLTYSEIASTVGIPEGTVGSRLNRARKELREQLSKLGWERGRRGE